MKNYESRIKTLEQKLLPQSLDKSIIFTTIGSDIFKIDEKTFTKSEEITDKEFLDGLAEKGLIAPSRVVIYIPEISMDGYKERCI